MADGSYRFHQPGAGPFYSTHHNRNHNRGGSPHGPRRPLLTDTPSPSRSPANSAMAHNFGMFNQNGYQGQHMMNGGQNHQRFGGMHVPKHNPNYHGHHGQHHAQQQHAGQIGHQHNLSSGAFPGNAPSMGGFGQEHLQNGHRDAGQGEEFEDGSEYWQEQRRLFADHESMSEGHHRARSVAQQSKGVTLGGALGNAVDEPTLEDRTRGLTIRSRDSHQAWTELDMGGQGLRALAPNLYKYTFLTRLDVPHNSLRMLPSEIGQLKNLEYLDISFNQLQSLPEEMGMLINLRTLLLCGNYISILPDTLGYLYKLESIAVMPADGIELAEDQRRQLAEGGTKGLIHYLLETMKEPPAPMERPWHVLDEQAAADTEADIFKAVTYNILCERYAPQSKYGYVPESVLSWSYRKQLVYDELADIDADVVCLQELDRHSYDEYFRSKMSLKGFKGYFAQKSRAETIGENAKFVDGCGTFWKDRKYVLLDTQHLVLGRKAVDRPGAKASADMLNRVWQRDDIATVAFLENRVTGSRLIVVNSHIYWDPAFKDVKFIQAAVLMEEVSKLADKYAKHPPATNKQIFRFTDEHEDAEPLPEPGPSMEYSSGTQIPMLLCGDFNSAPGSPVYELFTKRSLDAGYSDLAGRDYGSFSSGGMSHNFTLKSTNALIDNLFITNYTPDFVDELDHIFYSSNSLRPLGVLGAVDPEYLKRVPGFPSHHYPSDHLALVAEFKVEKQRSQKVVEADFGPGSRR